MTRRAGGASWVLRALSNVKGAESCANVCRGRGKMQTAAIPAVYEVMGFLDCRRLSLERPLIQMWLAS